MFKLSIFLVKTFSFEFKETIEMYWREIGESYFLYDRVQNKKYAFFRKFCFTR